MTCMQASAISKMGAEVTQHNKLLLQLAKSFPASHSGATVYTYDFGAAFDQASFPVTSILRRKLDRCPPVMYVSCTW